jgi:hypothetical protein
MKVIWQSVLSLILGFLGGIVAVKAEPWLRHREAPLNIRAGTVRADRFELAGTSDRPIAYWGRDWQRERILIGFNDEKGQSRAEFGIQATQNEGGRLLGFKPYTALLGSDGKVRLQQLLDETQKPVLAMGDSQSEARLLLGHFLYNEPADLRDPCDKWSLVFTDPTHSGRYFVDLGATTPLDTRQRTGYLVLRNSSGRRLDEWPK